MDAIELAVFEKRMQAVCAEMGAALRKSALSPNIRDRLDYSCAVFDRDGRLAAQAAHIPVHLGSMAYALRDVVRRFDWEEGDAVLLNDPFLGGTHLPDVTVITPCLAADGLCGFLANRAHHADIGAEQPGSMPISRSLEEEGLVLSPRKIRTRDCIDEDWLTSIVSATRVPDLLRGDLLAQLHANDLGVARLRTLAQGMTQQSFEEGLRDLNEYGRRIARETLRAIPDGTYEARGLVEDDGLSREDIGLQVRIRIHGDRADVDFSGTDDQVEGPLNCPLPVTAAAVYYVFRCLMPEYTPACAGVFETIRLSAPAGCLLNARPGAAVAAGNVETSMRIVELLLAALGEALPERIPAASQGTMNNIAAGAAGDRPWAYYETVAGGLGAHAHGAGLSARQAHMTNTCNTPVEVLEQSCPLRVRRYAVRRDSGGSGQHPGGSGVVREFEFLADAQFSLLSESRRHPPAGRAGGADGSPGRNSLNGEALPGKCHGKVSAGDRLMVETPGGGGWGAR